jgi:hypothetical protein
MAYKESADEKMLVEAKPMESKKQFSTHLSYTFVFSEQGSEKKIPRT